jgi:hypothetical protein
MTENSSLHEEIFWEANCYHVLQVLPQPQVVKGGSGHVNQSSVVVEGWNGKLKRRSKTRIWIPKSRFWAILGLGLLGLPLSAKYYAIRVSRGSFKMIRDILKQTRRFWMAGMENWWNTLEKPTENCRNQRFRPIFGVFRPPLGQKCRVQRHPRVVSGGIGCTLTNAQVLNGWNGKLKIRAHKRAPSTPKSAFSADLGQNPSPLGQKCCVQRHPRVVSGGFGCNLTIAIGFKGWNGKLKIRAQ